MFQYLISDVSLLEKLEDELSYLSKKTLENFDETSKDNIIETIVEIQSEYFGNNLLYYLQEEYKNLDIEIEKIFKKLLTK